MTMEKYNKYTSRLALQPPATSNHIDNMEKTFNLKFPSDYIDFLLFSNGADGFIGDINYISLYAVDDVIETNVFYHSDNIFTDFIFFAGDGGGEGFAFDIHKEGWPIYQITLIDDQDYSRFRGNNFLEFLEYIHNEDCSY